LPFVIRALPARVRLDELAGRHGHVEHVVLGLGGESGEPVKIRVGPARGSTTGVRFLVAGPPRSGRSTLLSTIMIQLTRRPHFVVAAGGPRSPIITLARVHDVATLYPDDDTGHAINEMEERLNAGQFATLLIDDTELFADGPVGERVTALVRSAPSALDVFAAGRVEDLALAFGGVAAEMRRARTGVLLQPGPGDGDLFGLRLPFHRSPIPAGRGLLIAPDLIADPTGPAALPLQVAQP
jgi:S-DNA-T family DNA segregation ATPase FtsK/SpoIIIE